MPVYDKDIHSFDFESEFDQKMLTVTSQKTKTKKELPTKRISNSKP